MSALAFERLMSNCEKLAIDSKECRDEFVS
jgi:hypothetical protein